MAKLNALHVEKKDEEMMGLTYSLCSALLNNLFGKDAKVRVCDKAMRWEHSVNIEA